MWGDLVVRGRASAFGFADLSGEALDGGWMVFDESRASGRRRDCE